LRTAAFVVLNEGTAHFSALLSGAGLGQAYDRQ